MQFVLLRRAGHTRISLAVTAICAVFIASLAPSVHAGTAAQDEKEHKKHHKENENGGGAAPSAATPTAVSATPATNGPANYWYVTLHDDANSDGSASASAPKDKTKGHASGDASGDTSSDVSSNASTTASNSSTKINQQVHAFGADGSAKGVVLGPAPATLGELQDLRGLLPLPDGTLLLIAAWKSNTKIVHYAAPDSTGTRAFLSVFAQTSDANPLLVHPYCLAIGPDGSIYASNQDSNTVTRYGAPGGAHAGVPLGFDGNPSAASANAGLVVPSRDMDKDGVKAVRGIAFGNDGKLYVADRGKGEVTRWDTTTGKREAVVLAKKDGIDTPIQLLFSADAATLYISDNKANEVFTFALKDRTFATLVGTDAGIDASSALAIDGPWLYVGSRKARAILRFSITDGAADSAPFVTDLPDNPEFFVRNRF